MRGRHHRRRTSDGHETPRRSRHGRSASAGAPAGRAMGSGSISFGLLQIPVSLFPAERRTEEIHFRLLDKRDLQSREAA